MRWTRLKGRVECDPAAVLVVEQRVSKKQAAVLGFPNKERSLAAESVSEKETAAGDDSAMAEQANVVELLRTMMAQQNAAIQA
ncbi:unnamed protein product [Linum trigynum]|uniref:FHA domain-containing protein n=1 Tax=Linum trigynum TaxID=586398 RepID=A0AAV2GFD5_9ROSI